MPRAFFDEKGADGILATLLTDRRLSVDFFADERRMERNLLADGAEARVLQLFGPRGAVSAPAIASLARFPPQCRRAAAAG